VTAALSAVLANDIVCLAVTPIMVEACARRRLNPMPFLLALACASNIGSAATIIGNPQNMLIGQVLQISFIGYFLQALPPVLVGLGLTWLIIAFAYRDRWEGGACFEPGEAPVFNPWQTSKGLVILFVLMVFFLLDPAPREIAALVGAAILLCSRRMRSREMLGLVDWQLLLLFVSLFALNHVMRVSGNLDLIADALRGASINLESPAWLFALCLPLSNIVSNVPAVMLLLPYAQHPAAGTVLALSSTLAGNLIIVGSIANIIVVEQAARMGVAITWKEHAKIGVPVTLTSLAVTALWLWLTI
jgi:Na+/H+ antiporter NhaD/arsenite permease-like protein